jgi:prephenate dehydratase
VEYAFYVDVVGSASEEPLAGALENLRRRGLVKVLGSNDALVRVDRE